MSETHELANTLDVLQKARDVAMKTCFELSDPQIEDALGALKMAQSRLSGNDPSTLEVLAATIDGSEFTQYVISNRQRKRVEVSVEDDWAGGKS